MIEIIEGKKAVQVIKLTCSDCGAVLVVETTNKDAAFAYARKNAWAVSRDRKCCYCANCAPHRRHVGKYGTRRARVQTRIFNV